MTRIYSYTGEPVGIAADMQPHILFSATIPANTLSADGGVIRVEVDGTTIADASAKYLTVTANGVNAGEIEVTGGDTHWHLDVVLVRTAAAGNNVLRTKSGLSNAGQGSAVHGYVTSGSLPQGGSVDWTQPVTVALVAQNGGEAVANSIMGNSFIVSVDA